MRKRRTFVTLLLALGLALSATAGVIAGGSSDHKGNSGKSQYKPGKGCGDKNHVHKRRGECKKPRHRKGRHRHWHRHGYDHWHRYGKKWYVHRHYYWHNHRHRHWRHHSKHHGKW